MCYSSPVFKFVAVKGKVKVHMSMTTNKCIAQLWLLVHSNTVAYVSQASPGKRQKLEHHQVSLKSISLLPLGIKGHRLCGVQNFCHLPTTVHDVREASSVEVGQ